MLPGICKRFSGLARRLVVPIFVTLLLTNPLLLTSLRATCFVQVSQYTPGISEFTITATRDLGSCKSPLAGYLFFQPSPSRNPLNQTIYSPGQSYAGATVIGYSAKGEIVIENGPYNVITPGTAYSPMTYSVFGYDDQYDYTDFKSSYFSLTTSTGGGLEKNWSYRMPLASLLAPSLGSGGRVVSSGNDGVLHSMSAASGAHSYAPGAAAGGLGFMGKPIQSTFPVVASKYLEPATLTAFGASCPLNNCDVAFVGAQDGTVWAFNVRTGIKLWQSPLLTNSGGSIVGAPVVQLRHYANSTFRNAHTSYDLVIVGTHNNGDRINNKLYGLRSDTGAVVWTFAPGNLDQINSTPAFDYATNTVWITSLSNNNTQPSIWKVDTLTGTKLADITLPTGNKDVGCSPTLNFNSAAPYLFIVTNGGDLVAINSSSNAVTLSTTNYGTALVKYPFVLRNASRTGDEIYFSNSSGVSKAVFIYKTGFSSSGGWTSTAVPSPSSPVPDRASSPTALYVGGGDGILHKLNVSDGAETDHRDVAGSTTLIGDANIDLQNGKIYVGDSSGRIYSYNAF